VVPNRLVDDSAEVIDLRPEFARALDSRLPAEGDGMTQFARVATFEADDAALDAMLSEIKASEGPPEGIPAKTF
jgi:hypothetical protein